jgi:hypothetical protein
LENSQSTAEYNEDWLESIVDTLASEYGWTKDYILNRIYPDESLLYIKAIDDRRRNDYLMKLAISTNPVLQPDDQKSLWNVLSGKDSRQISATVVADDKLDRDGFAKLKSKISKHSHIKVK